MNTLLRRIAAAVRDAFQGLRSGFRSVTEVPVNVEKFEHPGANDQRKLTNEQYRAALQTAIAKLKAESEAPKQPQLTLEQVFKAALPPPEVLPAGMAMDAAVQDFSGMMGWATTNSLFIEGLAFLGYPYLAQLTQRPEYRIISETWAQEMTRKWMRLTATSDGKESTEDKTEKMTAIEAELKRLNVQDLFRQVAEQDGYFGRSHIYIELAGTDNDREELKSPIGEGADAISRAKVTKGSLKGLRVIEPVWSYPNGYNSNDPLKADFFKPRTWFVMGQEIHATRLLTFIGRPVPDLLKPAYSFGGLSLSQMAKPYVDNWLRTRQSVSDAVSNFSIMVLLTDLAAMLQTGAQVDVVSRVDLFNATRDNRGLMVANKETEDLKNVSMPLGGLHELQAQSQEQMCSVSQIPLVKFTGIQPSGLNADSDGVIKVFYDKVNAQQVSYFNANLSKLLAIVQLHLFGEIDPEIGFVWEPLDTLDPAAEAARRKTEADTDCELIDHGVILPEEARSRLAADDMSPYASLDTDAELPEVGEQEGSEEVDEIGAPLMDGLLTGDAKFEESKHPRDKSGKFGTGSSRSLKPSSSMRDVYHTPMKNLHDTPLDRLHSETFNHLAALAEKKGKSEKVAIKDIISSQGGVTGKVLKEKLKGSSKHSGPVLGVRLNGKVVLLDGNHRVTSEWLRGADKVDVQVYDAGSVKLDDHTQIVRANRKLQAQDSDGLLNTDEKVFSAAGVLFITTEKQPRVLLLRRSNDDKRHPGFWDLPGGKMEEDESAVEGAIREAREEIGASVTPQHLKQIARTDAGDVDYTTFSAYTEKPFEPTLDDEHDKFGWFDATAGLPSPIIPPLADLLRETFA